MITKEQIDFFKDSEINTLSYFCYAYIGLMSGLFIFRKAFKILDYLYILCMVFLAVRALKYTIHNPLSEWTFIIKPYLLIISLVISIQLVDFNFMLKNLSAITSMLIMGLIFLKKPNESEIDSFLKALKICFIFNYIFATIQLFCIVIFKVNIFFYLGFYLHIYDSIDSNVLQNSKRITGFIWDPYVLGMFCAMGFFLFKSRLIKVWILILLYYSSSRSGQLGLMVACLYYYWHPLKKMLAKDYLLLPLLFFAFAICIINLPFIIDFFDLDRGFSRDSAGWRRVEYITKIPEIWEHDENFSYILFGGAPGHSGARYMLSSVASIAKQSESSLYWTIETDWFGIILGRGIIGFIFYILLYFKIFISNKSNLNKALALSIFIGGVGYIYDTAIFTCFIVYFVGNSEQITIKRINEIKCKNNYINYLLK